jgi:hypothetical protein
MQRRLQRWFVKSGQKAGVDTNDGRHRGAYWAQTRTRAGRSGLGHLGQWAAAGVAACVVSPGRAIVVWQGQGQGTGGRAAERHEKRREEKRRARGEGDATASW